MVLIADGLPVGIEIERVIGYSPHTQTHIQTRSMKVNSPGGPKTLFHQQLATFGKAKRWMSDDATDEAKNMRAGPYTNKTTQWGDTKVWWFMIVAKGVVHIEVMGQNWHQDPCGQAQLIARLPKILKKMLGNQDSYPEYVFTDRGPGFYHPSWATIYKEYEEALTKHGFTPWAGAYSKSQPPDIADILLHETAVAWVRKFLKQHPVKITHDLSRNIANLEEKLQEAVDHINEFYEVEDKGLRFHIHAHTHTQTHTDTPGEVQTQWVV